MTTLILYRRREADFNPVKRSSLGRRKPGASLPPGCRGRWPDHYGLRCREYLCPPRRRLSCIPSSQELPEDAAGFLKLGVGINACSLSQLRRIGKEAPGSSVGVRFNPGLGSGGTKSTNVGGPASSFGKKLRTVAGADGVGGWLAGGGEDGGGLAWGG